MSKSLENRSAAFSPTSFALLLAGLVFAAFPQVFLGWETFVARDFGFFAYPAAHFQQECFQHNQLPFWNPYNDCGIPFLAQWNTMPLYPPSLLYLTLPLERGLGLFSLAHLWWAGVGMYYLARRWTGNDFAAAFAGTAFAFNGFTLNLLMWPSHIATFSWLPWVVLTAEMAWREGGRRIFLAGITGALQMLAGGPETILLTWLIVLVLWLQQFIKAEAPRFAMIWRLPFVVALVAAVSAAQLLPFLDLMVHAQRETGYTDLRWSMPGTGLANFLVPMAFGNAGTEGIFFQHGQYWTSSYYLGIGVLWLALLAVVSLHDRRVWLLGAVAAVALVCALGENTPVYPLLRQCIPQLSFITYPVKFVMVVVFAAPLLAAFALSYFSKIEKRILPSGIILLLLLGGVLIWAKLAPLTGDDTAAALRNGISRAAFLLATGGVLLFLAYSVKSPLARLAPLALIAVAWADVYTHEPKQNPTAPLSVYAPNIVRNKLAMNPEPDLGDSRVMLSPQAALGLTRVATSDPVNNFLAKRTGYCANANLLDHVPKVDGFFSLAPHEFDTLLTLMYSPNNGNWSRLEDFMGASQISGTNDWLKWRPRPNFLPLVTAGQKPVFLDDTNTLWAFGRNDFDGRKIVFLPAEAKSFVNVPGPTDAKVLYSDFGNDSVNIEVNAAETALVVIAQTYYHNWRATVDGEPADILRANFAFQAVQIPKGRHSIQLLYRDEAFKRGWKITLGALIVCALGLLFGRSRV